MEQTFPCVAANSPVFCVWSPLQEAVRYGSGHRSSKLPPESSHAGTEQARGSMSNDSAASNLRRFRPETGKEPWKPETIGSTSRPRSGAA
uniref:Uncharacterized protein n=1 Tax=Arundo donax TaxID=35708 RepID=A0A0A9EYQ9_ARUDO